MRSRPFLRRLGVTVKIAKVHPDSDRVELSFEADQQPTGIG